LQALQGKNILITGGAGYLATNILYQMKDMNCHIIRFDRPDASFLPLEGKFSITDTKGDVRDRDIWNDLLPGTDIVFHLAAQTSVYVAAEDPFADLEINVLPILHLLETCRKNNWHPAVLFSGTVTEAGLTEKLPVDEFHPDHPITVYDLHKLMAENYLKHYARENIVNGSTLRLANVYGPGPKSSSADRGILNKMVRKAINGEPLTLYGKGNHIRDYIYVEDVARAFIKAAENIEKLNARHFIIGSGIGYTLAEAFNLVIERAAIKTGRHVDLLHIDPPHAQDPIESRNFVADTTSFCNITGWKANHSLICGIDHTIDSICNRDYITESSL
jgi:nucleoside-diphosphate-sugar epimerase